MELPISELFLWIVTITNELVGEGGGSLHVKVSSRMELTLLLQVLKVSRMEPMDASAKTTFVATIDEHQKHVWVFQVFLVQKFQILLSFRIYHLFFKNCKKASVLWFSMIKVFFNVTTTMSIIDFAYALKTHSLVAQFLCSSLVACNACGLFKTLCSL